MPIRSLLVLAALAAGDYVLWNWSSDGNSDTVALVSGLVLALLLIALLWLIALSIVRGLLARTMLAGQRNGDRRRAARQAADGDQRPLAAPAPRTAKGARISADPSGRERPPAAAEREESHQPTGPGDERLGRATAGSTSSATPPPRSDRVAA